MRFRSKPVEIEADQLTEHHVPAGVCQPGSITMHVVTIHGDQAPVVIGDWIITEPDGVHHYPRKPEIFKKRYELIPAVETAVKI